MRRYSRLQSNGTWATRVTVHIIDNERREVFDNTVTLISRTSLSTFEASHAAITLMVEQIEREGEWGTVLGATAIDAGGVPAWPGGAS